MIDIKELAAKHGGKFHGPNIEHLSIPESKLQAFVDEYAALVSSEPVAWRYQTSNGVYRYCKNRTKFNTEYAILKPIALHLANPINQALLESHKRLEGLLEAFMKLSKDNAVVYTFKEVLAAIPESVKDLK